VQRSIADMERAASMSIADLSPASARQLAMQVVATPSDLAVFGPRRCLLHLLNEIGAGSATVARAAIDSLSNRYARLVVARPDGYLAHALSGDAIQRAGSSVDATADGAMRAGPYEIGRFYYSDGGVFYETDQSLQRTGGPIGELGLEHDLPNKVLDGVEDAVVATARGIARLITHPVQSLADLARLPGVVRQLVANSPEYWERFQAMPIGDQVRKVSEIVTNLTLLCGTAAGTTTRLAAAAGDLPELTISALRLQSDGSFAVAQVTVPVGTMATALAGGPGAIYVLSMMSQQGGGGGQNGGGEGREPGVTSEESANESTGETTTSSPAEASGGAPTEAATTTVDWGGPKAIEHLRRHAQDARVTARRLGMDVPRGLDETKQFLERVVATGEQRIGTWGDLGRVRMSKLGDAVVIRRMTGEYVTNMDASRGGTIVVRWTNATPVR